MGSDTNREAIPVLVVDDSADIRETVRLALEDDGYTVLEAEDGQTALDILRHTERGMVVLVDHLMPGIDGLAMLGIVSAEPSLAERHVYVMLTADGRKGFMDMPGNSDAWSVPIVAKPFDLEELLDVVSRARTSLLARLSAHVREQ